LDFITYLTISVKRNG